MIACECVCNASPNTTVTSLYGVLGPLWSSQVALAYSKVPTPQEHLQGNGSVSVQQVPASRQTRRGGPTVPVPSTNQTKYHRCLGKLENS